MSEADERDLHRERWELLQHLNAFLDTPMIVLSFIWLGLLILDLTTGLGRALERISYAIWALFVLHFLMGILIAPSKLGYLRQNVLTALALILPAFRLLRVFSALRFLRAARAAHSLNLLRLVTTLNRGMRAVSRVLGRRGVGYVAAITAIVTLAGAAGMAQFESPLALREAGYVDAGQSAAGLGNYGEALWWTAMIMTTMGSEYWPKTVEGRILGWLLALYAFAIFGYLTATIASIFIGQDAAAAQRTPAASDVRASETAALRTEIAVLRSELTALRRLLDTDASAALQPETRATSPAR